MDIIQPPTEISWGGNIEENWLQKFELYIVASEKKMIKSDKITFALFLHMAGGKTIEAYNTLIFTDTETGN